jgi:four helix bundle protein
VVSDQNLKGGAAMILLHYRELIAWQKAMALVREVYQLSDLFPKDERFGLTSQIRRAAVSVPSNIAEGQGRDSTREFIHHLSIAYGSLMEVETQVLIGLDLGYVEKATVSRFLKESSETGRIINGLMRSLRRKLTTDH